MSQPTDDPSIAEESPFESHVAAGRQNQEDKESDLAETGRLETLCDGVSGRLNHRR